MDMNQGMAEYLVRRNSDNLSYDDQMKMAKKIGEKAVSDYLSKVQSNRTKKQSAQPKSNLVKSTTLFDEGVSSKQKSQPKSKLIESTDLFDKGNATKGSSKSSVNLNQGMAEYLVRRNSDNLSYDDQMKMAKMSMDKKMQEQFPSKPKETITRAEEKESAQNIFNSGKKQSAPQRIVRESAPVIDFEMLASRGYAQPEMSSRPGEDMPNPMAQEQPKQRLGKDLLYSKARGRSADELAEQAPMTEPTETAKPNYDDVWANASDEDKAKFVELLARQKN